MLNVAAGRLAVFDVVLQDPVPVKGRVLNETSSVWFGGSRHIVPNQLTDGALDSVIKHADELSLMGLARAISDLGERARTKKLSPDDIQRGTFTITNPGGFGPFAGIPIINQPQVAILGVGAIEKRPKVVAASDGTESIAIRPMGMLTMSYDHRVVDGADADKFLADVKQLLQEFPEGAL